MRLDEILEALRADLEPWVKTKRGQLSIALDPWNVLELLVNGPQGFQVILHWGGDDATGDQPAEPLADNTLEVIVGYNLGLNARPDLALVKNLPERPSLLKLVNDVRARVLSYVFPPDVTMQTPEYAGCKPVTLPEGIPLAAYKFQVKLTALVERDEQLRGSVETEN